MDYFIVLPWYSPPDIGKSQEFKWDSNRIPVENVAKFARSLRTGRAGGLSGKNVPFAFKISSTFCSIFTNVTFLLLLTCRPLCICAQTRKQKATVTVLSPETMKIHFVCLPNPDQNFICISHLYQCAIYI